MTTIADVYQGGVDAVIADNTLNRAGFVDAMQLVVTGISNAEGVAYVDALAVEYERLGIINNPTYSSLRNEIINEGAVTTLVQFESLATVLNALPEASPIIDAVSLFELRDTRDQINAAIDRCDVLIAAEPSGKVGRLVKDVLREGKRLLRQHKSEVRDHIQSLTGDPDS